MTTSLLGNKIVSKRNEQIVITSDSDNISDKIITISDAEFIHIELFNKCFNESDLTCIREINIRSVEGNVEKRVFYSSPRWSVKRILGEIMIPIVTLDEILYIYAHLASFNITELNKKITVKYFTGLLDKNISYDLRYPKRVIFIPEYYTIEELIRDVYKTIKYPSKSIWSEKELNV